MTWRAGRMESINIRKPWRARKTMKPILPSNQKQVEMLNTIKNFSGQENIANGVRSEDGHVTSSTSEANCHSDNSVTERTHSESNATPLFPQKPTEPLKIGVNSEVDTCDKNVNCDSGQEKSQDPPPEKSSSAKPFLNAGCLQDLLHQWYENELNSPSSKPVEVHLNFKPNSNSFPPNQLKDLDYTETSPNKKIPVLEKVDTKLDTSIFKESIPILKRVDLNHVNYKNGISSSVLPSKNTTDILKSKACQHCSNISEDGEATLKLQDTSAESHVDNAQRKRMLSGSSENIHYKRIRSLEREDHWGKVQSLIQNKMDNLLGDFDHKLERLYGKVEQTQCRRKHEAIAITIVKKISKLERRVNAVVAFQKKELSKKAKRPGADSQNQVLNRTAPLPSKINDQSGSSINPVPLSNNATASATSSDEMWGSLKSRNSAAPTTNTSDPQKKVVPPNGETSVDTCPPNKKTEGKTRPTLLVIDLTEEEKNSINKGRIREDLKTVLEKISSELESPNTDQLKPMGQTSSQTFDKFSHLPPLPRIPPHLEPRNGFGDTLPPQKLELSVVQIKNPKGIALQWNVSETDPRCAPVESFHLFIYQQSSKNATSSRWTKTNEIKALPLPMACSLSQVSTSSKCYFAIQARDIYGRYGPFCDIQSTLAL
uniref:Activating transcription factor 7 interacting protein 2 n=1 Tax=Sphenodon punctatus TaxID=8508 RepID=A0A8D0G973_SPHPU